MPLKRPIKVGVSGVRFVIKSQLYSMKEIGIRPIKKYVSDPEIAYARNPVVTNSASQL